MLLIVDSASTAIQIAATTQPSLVTANAIGNSPHAQRNGPKLQTDSSNREALRRIRGVGSRRRGVAINRTTNLWRSRAVGTHEPRLNAPVGSTPTANPPT